MFIISLSYRGCCPFAKPVADYFVRKVSTAQIFIEAVNNPLQRVFIPFVTNQLKMILNINLAHEVQVVYFATHFKGSLSIILSRISGTVG